MVEFVRDVMIAVAVLATVIALAVRSGGEHEPGPRISPAERPAVVPVANLQLPVGAPVK